VDIELIALAYRKWGSACVDHLLGDFAFCIWDRERRTLLGARDHFGVIPFYLAQRGATLIVSNGSSVTLRSPFNALPPISYQWIFNGHAMLNATNATLVLTGVESTHSGAYSLIASNFAGVASNMVATVKVAAPIRLGYSMVRTNSQNAFRLTGPSSQGYTVEVATNMANWQRIMTNSSATATPIDFLDLGSTNLPRRFYRVVPWP